jgi:hypothetical protein
MVLCPRLNEIILARAPSFSVADAAPNCERDLWTMGSMVVWSGASDRTVFGDPAVNWAFRAVHDAMHLATGLGFSPAEEIEMGRRQASTFDGGVADIVFLETAGQAEYFLRTGKFVEDQVAWTLARLKEMGR